MILVGIDESEGAAAALRWAAQVGAALDEPVVALRAWAYGRLAVHPDGEPQPGPEAMDERERADAAAFVAATLGEHAGVSVRVARGLPRHALVEAVHELSPSMVVVGHRQLGPASAVLMGSVATRLMERSEAPVVMVRGEDRHATEDRVVVGVDGSEHSTRALVWAAGLASALGWEVVAAHAALAPARMAVGAIEPVTAAQDPVLAEAAQHLERLGVAHRVVLEWGDPRTVLEDVALREHARLLAVGTRGSGALARLVVGSVAGYVARHVAGPVAVIPPTAPG